MSQTILVADDSQTIRKVVKMALKVAPFEVASVGSGQQALQEAQQGLGLVLLDYHFPDTSGYEVARQLKQQPATSEVPIVMLAGGQHGFDEGRARESGVDRIIPKPFDTDTLLDAIVATTNVSKKALVKRQKGAPKTRTPLSGKGSGGPSAEQPPTPGGPAGMDTGRASGGSSGGRRRQSSGSNSGDQPRMRTPDSQSGSGSSSGSSPRRAGSGAEQPQSGARRPSGSGAAQSPESSERRPSGGGPPSTPPDAASEAEADDEPEAVELDIDLEEESEPEPNQQAPDNSQSKPRFQSPSGNDDTGGSRRRPVTTPESQAGSPAGGRPNNGGGAADSRTDTPESQSSPVESGGAPPQADGAGAPSGGGGLAGAGIDQQQLEQMVEAHVKETVREKLPKILRKLMGEVFQERVLPKLVEHGEQQVESLVGDQLDKRIHDEVQRQLDQLLEEL